jgi:hypothetical protein
MLRQSRWISVHDGRTLRPVSEIDPAQVRRVAEEDGLPPPVQIAVWSAYALALSLLVFGFIGFVIANAVDDSFGGVAFALGLVVAGAAYAASRGNSIGRAVIGLGAAVTAVVGVIYAFTGPGSATIGSLLMAALAAGTFALLYLTDSARRFYAKD